MNSHTRRTTDSSRRALQTGAIAALVLGLILPLCYYVNTPRPDVLGIYQWIASMFAGIGLVSAVLIGGIVWAIGRSHEKDI